MDVQTEARSLLKAWLRQEELAAQRRPSSSREMSPGAPVDLARRDAQWNAYRTVEGRLKDPHNQFSIWKQLNISYHKILKYHKISIYIYINKSYHKYDKSIS